MKLRTTKYRLNFASTGETFELSRSARTSPDKRFRFVWTLAPKKRGPNEHCHEDADETFEIVSGTLRIWLEGEPRDYRAGETTTIPAGVRHRFLNPGNEPVVVNVALDGTRMEDVLVPTSVALQGRAMTLADFLRIAVTASELEASVPPSRATRSLLRGIGAVLKKFGVQPFEPVHNWDAMADQGDERAVSYSSSTRQSAVSEPNQPLPLGRV